jgi:hypothetical protein
MSSLFIPKRIEEGCMTCHLYSFQRESKRGKGHVVCIHSKENLRGVKGMSSLFIPKRI